MRSIFESRFTRDCAWRALVAFARKRSMKRSIRSISACCLSIALPSAISRAACSRRQACQVPGKKRERPASNSRTAVPTASRNQRSCATKTIAASSETSVCSSHSSDSMSRWLVGSSSSSTSAEVASARASEARVSWPPEKLSSPRSRSSSPNPEPARHRGGAVAPQVAAARLQTSLRAAVAGEQRLVARPIGHAPLQLGQLGLDRELLDAARKHVLAQRAATLARGALVVQHDPRALRQTQLAAVDRLLPREHPQQRRLARAVAPGDRHARAALELEGHPAQKRLPGHVLVQVGCDQYGHRLLMVGVRQSLLSLR